MEECDAIQPFLAAYLRGSLVSGDLGAVERHLAGCTACRSEWDDFRSIHDLLGADAGGPAPSAVLEGALTVLAGEAGKTQLRSFRYAIPAGIAAAVLVGVTGYLLQEMRDTVRAPDPVAPASPVAARPPLPEPVQDLAPLAFEPAVYGLAAGQIAWRKDAHDALALAGDARSAVLCMVDNPQCGYCATIQKTVLCEAAVVEATRPFMCLLMDYREVDEHPVQPPLLGIVAPGGEMVAQYQGNPLDSRALLAWLRENTPDGNSTVPFQKVVRAEETLQEAFAAYSGGDPAFAARRLSEFDDCCTPFALSAHCSQAETLREAIGAHVESRRVFVRDLAANGEMSRAREACRALEEDFRGTPFERVAGTLAMELDEMSR